MKNKIKQQEELPLKKGRKNKGENIIEFNIAFQHSFILYVDDLFISLIKLYFKCLESNSKKIHDTHIESTDNTSENINY